MKIYFQIRYKISIKGDEPRISQTGNHLTAKLDIRVVNKRRVVGGGYIHPFWVIEGNQIVLKMKGLGYRGRGGYDCRGGKAGKAGDGR